MNLDEVLKLSQEQTQKLTDVMKVYEDPIAYLNAKEKALEKLQEETVELYYKYINSENPILGISDDKWKELSITERNKLVLQYVKTEMDSKLHELNTMYPF